MADQDKEKQLEELLDSMLSRYSVVEPRPGLETRIIARLAEARFPRARGSVVRGLWAGAAAAAVATIVVAGFFSRPATQPVSVPNTAQTQPRPVPPALLPHAPYSRNRPRVTARPRAVQQRSTVAVRQEVFPTPVPLSEQEILVLRYLSRTPRQELVAQSRPDPSPEDGAAEQGSALVPGISNQRFSNQ